MIISNGYIFEGRRLSHVKKENLFLFNIREHGWIENSVWINNVLKENAVKLQNPRNTMKVIL